MHWIIVAAAAGYLLYKIVAAVRAYRQAKQQEQWLQKTLASARPIAPGLWKARFGGTGSWAILNRQKQPVTPFKYLNVYRLFNGFIVVDCLDPEKPGMLAGYVNTRGEEVIPCRYETAYPFRENGLAWVKYGGKWRLINTSGQEVTKDQWDVLDLMGDRGYDRVKKDGKYGIVSNDGTVLIPPVYDTLYPDHRGFFKVACGELWGVADAEGNLQVPLRYTTLKVLTPRRFLVEEQGRWGVWDLQDGQVQQCIWEEVGAFENGEAVVFFEGQKRLIDTEGNYVNPETDMEPEESEESGILPEESHPTE